MNVTCRRPKHRCKKKEHFLFLVHTLRLRLLLLYKFPSVNGGDANADTSPKPSSLASLASLVWMSLRWHLRLSLHLLLLYKFPSVNGGDASHKPSSPVSLASLVWISLRCRLRLHLRLRLLLLYKFPSENGGDANTDASPKPSSPASLAPPVWMFSHLRLRSLCVLNVNTPYKRDTNTCKIIQQLTFPQKFKSPKLLMKKLSVSNVLFRHSLKAKHSWKQIVTTNFDNRHSKTH